MTPPKRLPKKKKHDPWEEAGDNCKALFAETVPLILGVALSALCDRIIRALAATTGPEWAHPMKVAIFVTDGLTLATLVLPKGLVLLNRLVQLTMTVLETAAVGIRRIIDVLNKRDPNV